MRVARLSRTAASRGYASQVSTKGPLVYGFRPPQGPASASPASSPPSSPPASSSTGGQSSSSKPAAPTSTLPKPRLDYNALLSNPEQTVLNALRRGMRIPTQHLAHLSRLRETQLLLLQKLSTIRGKQREIGSLIRMGLGDVDESKRQAKKLKTRVKEYESTLAETESELLDLALALPNSSHPSAPVGPEDQAVTLETFGPDPALKPEDPRRDHVAFATHYDLIDTEASATTTGSSWPYLKGTLALLEQALIQYALSTAIRHGFTPVVPPDVIKSDMAWRCGFQPRDSASSPATQTYHLASAEASSQQLCLAGTSEIPLAGLFADRLFHEEDLPKKVVGVGRAFRAEAGARGADTRGLYRVHQFTKVELFAVSSENASEGVMEEIRAVQKEIAQGLGLSVRVLDMPTEELGASAHRKYDMEAWMPGRGKWGEITSTSNCTDYQSRRLSITYRPTPGQSPGPGSDSDAPPAAPADHHTGPLPFAHTLNGTAAAIPRLIVALLENGIRFKDAEGGAEGQGSYDGLDLPKALERFWVGGDEVGDGRQRGSIRWV
ncbi:serine-tRNA ligase [Kwoniella sp. DSM 27419]